MESNFNILNLGALVEALTPLADIVAERVLEGMKKQEQERKPKLFTPEQVCDILQVSKATLWRYERKGILKASILGGSKLYREEEIEEAINTGSTRKYARRANAEVSRTKK